MERKRRFVFTNSPQKEMPCRYHSRHIVPEAEIDGADSDTGGCGSTVTDPQGSWTGAPEDRYELPVQDADDL